MPCKICSTELIAIRDIPTCPNCKNLSLVPYDDSLEISKHYIALFKTKFEDIIKKFQKNKLLLGFFWEREKEIIRFNETYSTLDLALLTSSSLLIRRIIKMDSFLEYNQPTKEDIKKIIKDYFQIISFEEDRSKLESGTWNMINLVKYDLDRLEDLPLVDGIIVCPNEKYSRVMQTFAKHNIVPENVAEEKVKEWAKDFIHVERGSKKSKTSKETIGRFYEMISMLYTAFLRSSVFSEAYKIPNEKLDINPINIKKLLGRYIISHENVTEIDYSLFKEDVVMIFKKDFQKIFKNFVLSEENLGAMPIFLRIDNRIFVSQAFGELYSYFLHAIVNKEEFDNETERRSKIYEQKIVKEYFENHDFKYYNNFQIKNKMEIDGIAVSEKEVIIIEVKGWGSHKLLEEKTSKEILDREIKNAIDGIHIHQKTKTVKHKVPLKNKIEWASLNRNLFKIKKETPISGMLIINEVPTISEYNGCKVGFIDDFAYSKTGSRVMEEGR